MNIYQKLRKIYWMPALVGILVLLLGVGMVVADSETEKPSADTLTPSQKAALQWQEDYKKNYGKIKDPYHPWFNPDDFRFEDYMGSTCTKTEILAKLFPPSATKEFVDRILVKTGGATINPHQDGNNLYSYYIELEPGPLVFMTDVWNVVVQYDEKNLVQSIRMGGKSVYDFFQNCRFGKEYGRNWK